MINRISSPILRKEGFTKGYFSKVNYFEGKCERSEAICCNAEDCFAAPAPIEFTGLIYYFASIQYI
jgi:hypothetical protein